MPKLMRWKRGNSGLVSLQQANSRFFHSPPTSQRFPASQPLGSSSRSLFLLPSIATRDPSKYSEVAWSARSTMNRQSSATMSAHQRMEAVTDLTNLSPVSDDIIVACLRERFMSDNIYTNIGSSALVALNPHKYVSSNADSILHKYAAEYRDTSEHKQPLPPHIFQMANNAYYHMKRTTQDQCILFRCVILFSDISEFYSLDFQR